MATLIYDGDCGICTAAVDWIHRTLTRHPTCVASQSLTPADFGLTDRDVREQVWLVTANRRFGGHEAVSAVFRMQPEQRWRFLGHLMVTPPFSWAARAGYAWVAANRHRFSIGDVSCEVPVGR